MLTLLLGTDWKENRKEILNMISQDVASEKHGCILVVPELVSHQMERELADVAGDTASRFAEVLSFSRLVKRVAEFTQQRIPECLDNGGRIVAMAAATCQLHSKLKAYASVQTRPEFLSGLLDAVDEFKRCCITSADLMAASKQTEGSFAQKLEELSLILESYNSVCQRGKRDPRDQISWLLEELECCDFAAKHSFYLDAFPDFSKQNMEVLCHLIQYSPQVIISLNCDKPGSDHVAFEKSGATALELVSFAKRNDIPINIRYISSAASSLSNVTNRLLQGAISEGSAKENLCVFKADSIYSECYAAAEQIIELIEQGCRYRDISIVCTDLNVYKNAVESVMSRAHIPIYLSGTEDILDRNVIHTVLSALEAALGGFDREDVLRYMKSMLSPISLELSDRIDNYTVLWSIEGSRWFQPWEKHPVGLGEAWTEHDKKELEILNEAKNRALQPLARLCEGFKNAVGIQQQVVALYLFLEDIHLNKRLQKVATDFEKSGDHRSAQILNQLWEILLGALEQLHDVLNETTWDADTFTKLLKLLLSQYDVGTIPSVLDAVTVGSVSAMRCHGCKHLLILGASEGMFPSYGGSSGVLSDQERAALQKLGVPINPGAIDGLQTQFSEIQEVFCGARDSIRVFYSGAQPSYIYNRLKKLAGAEQIAAPKFGAALTDSSVAASLLISNRETCEAASLGLQDAVRDILDSKEHSLGQISQSHVKDLYGSTLVLSASQIDRLAECRLSYFLRYGLRAKERKAVRIDPAEFGTYVHAVLEECGRTIVEKGGFRNVSLDETLEIASEYSAKYFAERFSEINTDRLSYHFQKNTQEVKAIVSELWKEMQECQFQPVEFELAFGEGRTMPPVSIPGEYLNADLRGFVDRVDCWDQNGEKYIRVVDYKTGKKDFDYCDVFNGIGLQMLLYLYALEDGGECVLGSNPIISGVQYFPARVPFVASDGSLSDEEAEAAHSKSFVRKGLILSDEAVLQAMDPSENLTRLCAKRKKDGTITGDIATSHQFVQLKQYIYKLLKQMVDEIALGEVEPNPYTRGSSHNACRFCPYGAICHPATVAERRNYQAMTAERFWNEIERKEQENG